MKVIYRISETGYPKEKPEYINNINCFKNAVEKLGKETPKGQKSPDASISAFLRTLFNSVLVNSGDVFKLTVAADPKDPTGNRLLIVDCMN